MHLLLQIYNNYEFLYYVMEHILMTYTVEENNVRIAVIHVLIQFIDIRKLLTCD